MTSVALNLGKARGRLRVGRVVEQVSMYVVLAGAAVWIGANLIKSPSQFFNVLLDGLNNGVLYALIALGYTLVYGIIELINFAHGDLFMLGTVLAAHLLVEGLGIKSPGLTAALGIGLTLIVVMIFCAFINVSAEFLAYRRLRNAPKLAPLITAVGLSFIFQNIAQVGIPFLQPYTSWITNGSGQRSWPQAFPAGGINIGSVTIDWKFLIVLAVTTVLLLIMTFIVQRTRAGKAMRAVAQDQDGARLMGINVNRTISFTFALGGAMAGAAAVLYFESVGTTRYDAGFQLGLIAFTAAVLGGIGNLVGAVLGGVLIGAIQGINDGAPYGLGQKWSQTVVFAILILLMTFKPEGLLGRRTTEKV